MEDEPLVLEEQEKEEEGSSVSDHDTMVVCYESSSESCFFGPSRSDLHPSVRESTSAENSIRSSEYQCTTVLLREDKRRTTSRLISIVKHSCFSCFYDFFRSYRSSSPDERVTPFAVVLLLVLLVIYVLNQADRLVLPVVIPAGLRCDAALSAECDNVSNESSAFDNSSGHEDCIHFNDNEQGLLTGPAFIVIYVLAGLPLARLADTRSRSLVLVVSLGFWSIMVFLTGFTTQFWQLLVLRVFLGIGEAACNPVAYSLLADFFPPRHRACALSVYHYGVYLGGGLGWMVGAVNDVLDWRWTFRILGIAGMVMVPIAALALWEPGIIRDKRRARRAGKVSYTIKEVVLYLVTLPPFWMLLIAGSVRNIPGYALGAWLPTFYAREHEISATHYGIRVGLVVIFGGGLGSFLGGFLSDRLSSRWKNAKAIVIAVSQLLAAPSIAAVLLVPSVEGSFWLLFLAYVTAETWLGPAAAIVQDICMPAMRAQASAVYIGVITIVASLGPVIVPVLIDFVNSFDKCHNGVRHALLVLVPTLYVVSAVLFALLAVVIYYWSRKWRTKQSGYAIFNTDSEASLHSDQ